MTAEAPRLCLWEEKWDWLCLVHGGQPATCFYEHFGRHTATPACSCVVCGCSRTIVAELSCCVWPAGPKIFTVWLFTEKKFANAELVGTAVSQECPFSIRCWSQFGLHQRNSIRCPYGASTSSELLTNHPHLNTFSTSIFCMGTILWKNKYIFEGILFSFVELQENIIHSLKEFLVQ